MDISVNTVLIFPDRVVKAFVYIVGPVLRRSPIGQIIDRSPLHDLALSGWHIYFLIRTIYSSCGGRVGTV